MNAPARTYDDARRELYRLAPRGIVLGLEPVRTALEYFGAPQSRVPSVHVAGTNGKGSVCAMVAAALRATGQRVGLYTSPHLHRYAERFCVNGQPVDEARIAEAAWQVLDAVRSAAIEPLTFFEATTVIAWKVFATERVDVAVLEVGLGGRLDATNVCRPTVTAITRIAKDHEALLGDSIASIAAEKAGILKFGVPCVLGPSLAAGEARDVIANVATTVGAPLVDAPAVERAHDDVGGLDVSVRIAHDGEPLRLGLAGAHQCDNAAVAIGVCNVLGVSRAALRVGLSGAQWSGRLERIGNVLLDAAHNPDGIDALVPVLERLQREGRRVAIVFGASSDKDWPTMLASLSRVVPEPLRFTCAAPLGRAEPAQSLASRASAQACASVALALERARACVGDEGIVCVCGSIFVVAEARAGLLGLAAEPPIAL